MGKKYVEEAKKGPGKEEWRAHMRNFECAWATNWATD